MTDLSRQMMIAATDVATAAILPALTVESARGEDHQARGSAHQSPADIGARSDAPTTFDIDAAAFVETAVRHLIPDGVIPDCAGRPGIAISLFS